MYDSGTACGDQPHAVVIPQQILFETGGIGEAFFGEQVLRGPGLSNALENTCVERASQEWNEEVFTYGKSCQAGYCGRSAGPDLKAPDPSA